MKQIEIKIIGAFLLGGGAVGVYRSVVALSNNFQGVSLVILLIMSCIMFFTAYSGFQILNNDTRGLINGRAIVLFQILQITIVGVGLSFFTGGYVAVHLIDGKLGLSYDVDSAFIIRFIENSNFYLIRINLVALAIFIYLTKVIRKENID